MPRSPAKPPLLVRMDELLVSAGKFVPPGRMEAVVDKWVDSSAAAYLPPERRMAALMEAIRLASDLVLTQPSASGATAFDRLAKNGAGMAQTELPLLEGLRRARHRLVRLEPAEGKAVRMACDALSGEALRLPAALFAGMPDGLVLFVRLALLPDGMHFPAGVAAPLDDAAFAIARGHGAAGSTSVFANARWAEAVYAHIVWHGTLDISGIHRPDDLRGEAPDEPTGHLLRMARRWSSLGEAAPDEALLQDTRRHAAAGPITVTLDLALEASERGDAGLAQGLDRMLLAMLETIRYRERNNVGNLTLDLVGQHVQVAESRFEVRPGARSLFNSLRKRLSVMGPGAAPDDVEMGKLIQRIQALRAKTVGQGCTEQEALAAAEKVAELLDRYGLSLGELDFKAQSCEGTGIQTNRKRFAPIDNCTPTIAEFFDCRVWVEQPDGEPLRYVFFGVRADVAAVQYLYELVERAFDTETDAFRRGAIYASMEGERRQATKSFQIGLAQGICDKLRALQAARDAHRRSASGRDLVVTKAAVVDDELAKLGLELHARRKGGSSRVLTEAFDAGQAAAQRFEYAPAIGQAA